MNRRDFIAVLGVISAAAACREEGTSESNFDKFLEEALEDFKIPGMSLAVTRSQKLLYAGGHGLADVEKQVPMTENSLLNVASVAKTVTAGALLQLWEEGKFELDQDVNDFLDFSVRNPAHPETPITFRQLLAHRSSIADGPSYPASYLCGDPRIPLRDWIRNYFLPTGTFWNPHNFHSWSPGTEDPPQEEARAYSNVGYGLLGYLVEVIAARDFAEYCRERIFRPLGMPGSGWYLREIDVSRHAVPYTRLAEDFEISEDQNLKGMLPREGLRPEELEAGGLFPHCLYSFPNYPDGTLRSSVLEMASFLRAVMQAADGKETILLKPETAKMMLSNQHFGRALCWSPRAARQGAPFWGHSGGDPGVSTYMGFQPEGDLGFIVLFNTAAARAAHDRVYFQLQSEFG